MLMRLLLWLLGAILAITVLRTVIGAVARWMGNTLNDPGKRPVQGGKVESIPAAGVLRKDPVCGTYVLETASVQQRTKDGVVHFCSEACRQKYLKAAEAS